VKAQNRKNFTGRILRQILRALRVFAVNAAQPPARVNLQGAICPDTHTEISEISLGFIAENLL